MSVRVDVVKSELLFLIIFSISTHVASRPEYRKYFFK